MRRSRHGEQAPEPCSEAPPDAIRLLLVIWAVSVLVLFLIQPSTAEVLLAAALSLLGGAR